MASSKLIYFCIVRLDRQAGCFPLTPQRSKVALFLRNKERSASPQTLNHVKLKRLRKTDSRNAPSRRAAPALVGTRCARPSFRVCRTRRQSKKVRRPCSLLQHDARELARCQVHRIILRPPTERPTDGVAISACREGLSSVPPSFKNLHDFHDTHRAAMPARASHPFSFVPTLHPRRTSTASPISGLRCNSFMILPPPLPLPLSAAKPNDPTAPKAHQPEHHSRL